MKKERRTSPTIGVASDECVSEEDKIIFSDINHARMLKICSGVRRRQHSFGGFFPSEICGGHFLSRFPWFAGRFSSRTDRFEECCRTKRF